MKVNTATTIALLFTLLAGSTIYLASQSNEESQLSFPYTNCGVVRDDFPVATAQNLNPQRTLSIYNNCYKTVYSFSISYEDLSDGKYKEYVTPCLKGNEQRVLPFDQPNQINQIYQYYCRA